MTDLLPTSGVLLVFDGSGRLLAATADAASLGPIDSLDELTTALVSPDGTTVDLTALGPTPAVLRGPWHRPAVVHVEHLVARDGSPAGLAVTVRPLTMEDDAETTQHVLASVLGHELRTPLTTIFGGAQLLANAAVADDTKVQAATSVSREAQHLHRTVEDLIALVRNGREAPEIEPLLLQHTVPPVVDDLAALRPGNTITVALPPDLPPVLAADPPLGQLLTNLLDHALIYSPPGGTVTLEGRVAPGAVEIRVLDVGPGRDGAAARGAFDLFHRSDRTSADRSGANLSLAVSRRLAEKIGATIRATERQTGGELVLSIPIADG